VAGAWRIKESPSKKPGKPGGAHNNQAAAAQHNPVERHKGVQSNRGKQMPKGGEDKSATEPNKPAEERGQNQNIVNIITSQQRTLRT